MSQFKTGKIPTEILVRNVFRYTGVRDRSVILGSSIGEDAALVALGKNVLVLTTDPVTGTASDIGWLAVHVNANDVACRGATPRWFLCDLLLPERSGVRLVDQIMRQVDEAAKQIHVAIVGGHTEVTPGLKRPLVIGYMMGVVARSQYVTSSGAKPGDDIIMTKEVGIEGTAVLASDFSQTLQRRIGRSLVQRAKTLRRSISVVDDALIAVRAGGVKAMHDPTEGGLLQGIWELASASSVGFLIDESRIPIRPETRKICWTLRVNPLRLMSSGCLLIAADRRRSGSIVKRLRSNRIRATIIGEITRRRAGRKLVSLNGRHINIGASERDELYRVIESHKSRL